MNKQKMQTPAIEVLAENFWTMRDVAIELQDYNLAFKFKCEEELYIRVEDFDDWHGRVYELSQDGEILPLEDVIATLEYIAEDLLDGGDQDPREAPDDDCEGDW